MAVIGGSLEYTGAPYFAAMSALRAGADLAFVVCESAAAAPIKSYSPDLIVLPLLRSRCAIRRATLRSESVPSWTEADAHHIAESIDARLARIDALIVGPGLGRDPLMVETAR